MSPLPAQLPCATYVDAAMTAHATVHYLNEYPSGQRHKAITPEVIVVQPGYYFIDAQGWPVAIKIYAKPLVGGDYEPVRECGYEPPPFPWIWKDDFETGDTSRWSRQVAAAAAMTVGDVSPEAQLAAAERGGE